MEMSTCSERQMTEPLHDLMPDGEINDETKNVVERSNERTCCQGGVNLEPIQRHRYPSAKETGKQDYEKECYANSDTQGKIHVKEQAHRQNNRRANKSVDETYPEFLP